MAQARKATIRDLRKRLEASLDHFDVANTRCYQYEQERDEALALAARLAAVLADVMSMIAPSIYYDRPRFSIPRCFACLRYVEPDSAAQGHDESCSYLEAVRLSTAPAVVALLARKVVLPC